MKTSVYIDGFNLYYACFRQQPRRCAPADKWLDLKLLAEHLAGPDNSIRNVHYFTAYIHRSKLDPEQNIRQEYYLRALRTVPTLIMHFGKHIPVTRRGELVKPDPASLGIWLHERVEIATFEEKGSDVNLATQLLDDSYEGTIEHAIVVSNDTDLIAPIRSARARIRVSVVSPHRTLAKELKRAADESSLLDHGIMKSCRLTIPVIDRQGREIFPPTSWQRETWEHPKAEITEDEL